MTFKDRLILAAGQAIVHTGSRAEGFMGETDVDSYDVVDEGGTKVGDVVVKDHTAVKGFKRTLSVIQRDASGAVLVEKRWNPER